MTEATTNNQEVKERKRGWKISQEGRFNMSMAKKELAKKTGKIGNRDIKPIVQLSKKDGRFIARYDNSREALRVLGKDVNRSDITACCRGFRNKKSAFGFVWKFEEDWLKEQQEQEVIIESNEVEL